MDPTLPDLFRAMGLQPLDDWIEDQTATGMSRRAGATTWMALSAAQCLKDGTDACILSPSVENARHIAQRVQDYAQRMSLGVREQGSDWVKFHNGTTLKWKSGEREVVNIIGFRGKIFNDLLWADRVARRAEGPYAMIRYIRREDGTFLGFAEDEECVMEFTEAGAMDFLRSNPEVKVVGFDDPRMQPRRMAPARVGKIGGGP